MKILKKILYFLFVVFVTTIITGTLVFLWVRLDSLKDKYQIINYLNNYYQNQLNEKDRQIANLEEEIDKLKENNQPLWYLPGNNIKSEIKIVKYEVELKEHSKDKNKTDIYVINISNNEKKLYSTLSNVAVSNNNPVEFHNGNLYIIKYLPNSSKKQLWRYDQEKKGSLLFESDDINFRISPYENYVAILSNNRLLIMSKDGIIKTYNHFDLGVMNQSFTVPFQINLLQWSDNEEFFWGNIHENLETRSYYKIDSQNWQVNKFDTIELLKQLDSNDRALNPNTAKLVYSDLPIFYDDQTAMNFAKSNKDVTLYLYDFVNNEVTVLVKNKVKAFNPIWYKDNVIEFYSTDTNFNSRKTIQ